MADVLRQDVEAVFDPEFNGCLPDVYVPCTAVADWQKVLNLVRSRGWSHEYAQRRRVLRLPFRAQEFLDRYGARPTSGSDRGRTFWRSSGPALPNGSTRMQT